ncbi:hypothetical protein WICPIJ_001231 [Wickerhamomyces pijperi]|uniref:Anaphase-promoting complex subunit 4 n=1 Tax=Wickerhamomyces pijperi TaxID=599730 RepID=A0A9P8QE36_WICPI|nr:hypothetical protein WICPIJ_001231 [Wickerhamomyces pijperi]
MTIPLNTLHSIENKSDGISQTTCPTMDLIALTSGNGSVLSLYRKSGVDKKPVWEINISTLGHGTIKSVVWKPDGRQIAIITNKDQCLICDANSALILSTIQGETDSASASAGLGFNVAGWYVISDINKIANDGVGMSGSGLDLRGSSLIQDVLKSLPKLPPLPSQTSNNWPGSNAALTPHKFATKQALESMVHSSVEDDLDLLFLFSESKVNLVLHELFAIGDVDLIPHNPEDEEIVNYITVSDTSSISSMPHYIITSSFTTMQYKLRRFNTSFLHNKFEYLQEITTSSSKIIALQGYIDEVLAHCLQDIKVYLDFNNRFVGILKSELEAKSTTAGDELYNLLLTGMMEDEVKDWIENTIGDRGVKRWIKASEQSFDNTRRSMIYHVAPACERILILLGNLGGAATSYGMIYGVEESFDISTFLKESKESVKGLIKTTFDFIQKINKEQSLYNAFISWIQVCLSELQDEKPKFSYITSEVSEFLNGYFEKSGLLFFTPFMKRSTNSVKIHTNELFKVVKSKMKKSITVDDQFSLSLGMVTETQQITQIDNSLFIITYHDTILDIHKFDLSAEKLQKISISMASHIQDLKLSTSNTKLLNDKIVNVLVNHELFQLSLMDVDPLFKSKSESPYYNIAELPSPYDHQSFENLNFTQQELQTEAPAVNFGNHVSYSSSFKASQLTTATMDSTPDTTDGSRLRNSFVCLISCDKDAFLTVEQ